MVRRAVALSVVLVLSLALTALPAGARRAATNPEYIGRYRWHSTMTAGDSSAMTVHLLADGVARAKGGKASWVNHANSFRLYYTANGDEFAFDGWRRPTGISRPNDPGTITLNGEVVGHFYAWRLP